MATDAQIIALADNSSLVHYDWPHRGYAPKAYLRGMAVAFSRLYRLMEAQDDTVAKQAVSRAVRNPIGTSDADVLAWYADELRDAGAKTATAAEKLVALLTIMLGLGMRESSGLHCRGADTEKDRGAPTTEEDAEAGLFQVSHDSIKGNAFRQSLFDAFRGHTDLLDIFSHDVTCDRDDWKNHGTGVGAEFQDTMKRCPLFAVLYTAQYLRDHRSHWGPIIHKAAEAKPEAVKLFQDVQSLIDNSAA